MNEKLQSIWKYNKIPVIISILGIIIFAIFIFNQATTPMIQLNGFLLNTGNEESDTSAVELANAFIATYDIDTSSGDIIFNDDYVCRPGNEKDGKATAETTMKILTEKERQSLDFVIASSDVMRELVYNTYVDDTPVFADIRSYLTSDLVELYEPYFLYIDLEVVAQLEEAYEKEKDTSSIKLPDLRKPEDMKNPVPMLIDLSGSQKLSEVYDSSADSLTFGIIADSPSRNMLCKFLDFVLIKED